MLLKEHLCTSLRVSLLCAVGGWALLPSSPRGCRHLALTTWEEYGVMGSELGTPVSSLFLTFLPAPVVAPVLSDDLSWLSKGYKTSNRKLNWSLFPN